MLEGITQKAPIKYNGDYFTKEYVIANIEVRGMGGRKHSIYLSNTRIKIFLIDIENISQTRMEIFPIYTIESYLNEHEFIQFSKELFLSKNISIGQYQYQPDSILYKKMNQIFYTNRQITIYHKINYIDSYIVDFEFVNEYYIDKPLQWHRVFGVLIGVFVIMVVIFSILLIYRL